jgi:PKD repeat protein
VPWLSFDGATEPSPPTLELLHSDPTTIRFQATTPGCDVETVLADSQAFSRLYGAGYGHGTQFGMPDLPVLRGDVEVPFGAEVSIEIVRAEFTDYSLAELGLQPPYPLQPPVPKLPGAQEDTTLVIHKDWYTHGDPFPLSSIALGEEYIIRGHRVQPVEVWPVAYDPIANSLRLYSSLTFRLRLEGSDVARTRALAERFASPAFEEQLGGQILNYNQGRPAVRFGPDASIGYLIITADAYYDAMVPFANLRGSRGYDVTMTRLSDIPGGGTNADILAYIEDAYWNWPLPPSYVLLVGDTDTMPTWPSQAAYDVTDLYYGCMDGGGDWHPEIFRGRFPVRSVDQATDMVDKYLAYAGFTGEEPWLKKAAFIATCDQYLIAEGTHNYVIDNYTLPNGYTGIFPNNPEPGGDKIYCVTHGGSSVNITNAANDGRWAIVYSGHGYEFGWADGAVSFSQSDVQNLVDYGFYPFVASHACSTGDFEELEAYCETWVLQEGKGALVFWGSSSSSYWGEDDILERAMFDSLFTDPAGYPTVGTMTDYGLAETEAMYPGSAHYYWETYNVMGDPAVKIFMEPDLPGFSMDIEPDAHQICGSDTVTSSILIENYLNYSETVYLQHGDLPAGVTVTITPDAQQAPFTATLTMEVVGTPAGEYTILFTATDYISWTHDTTVLLRVDESAPGVPVLLSPPDGAADQPTTDIAFDWEAVPAAASYQLQVDDDPAFGSPEVDVTGILTSNFILDGSLDPSTTYFWRVRAANGCGESAFSDAFSFTTRNLPCILVVDDDGDNPDVLGYYTDALDDLALDYDVWDIGSQGDPVQNDISGYQAILWFTGYPYGNTFNSANEAAVATYLDAGGHFFLSSQDYLYDFGLTPFGEDYLHIASYNSDVGQNTVTGDNPYAGLGPYSLSYPFTNYSDQVTPDGQGMVAFTGDQGDAAVAYDGGSFQTVFLGFPFEAIPNLPDRADVMAATVAFFGGCQCDPVHAADFGWEPPVPLEGEEVTFMGSASGTSPITYAWDFGDGNTGIGQMPTHIYTATGEFTVVMTATNCETATATVAHTLTVEPCEPAIVTGLSWEPPVPEVGSVVTFTGSASGTGPLSLTWSFGDGGVGMGTVVTHTYATTGSYVVQLVAENACGSDLVSETLTVGAPCQEPAVLVVADSPVELGQPMLFTATLEDGSEPFTYTWDLGGPGYGLGLDTATPVYTYTEAGTYTATVTVENACGSDSADVVVEVFCDEPVVAIASNSPVTLGEPSIFTSTVEGTGPFSYSWHFGDGSGYSSEANPVYTYTAAGDYTVTLTVVGPCGSDVITDTVAIEMRYFIAYLPIVMTNAAP